MMDNGICTESCCDNFSTEKNFNYKAFFIFTAVVALISFVLGAVAFYKIRECKLCKRLCGKKTVGKKTENTDTDTFDADEYVRSLNLD